MLHFPPILFSGFVWPLHAPQCYQHHRNDSGRKRPAARSGKTSLEHGRVGQDARAETCDAKRTSGVRELPRAGIGRGAPAHGDTDVPNPGREAVVNSGIGGRSKLILALKYLLT